MKNHFTIALAQIEITTDPAINLKKVDTIARKSASQGTDWVVFPEMTMGLPTPDDPPIKIVKTGGKAFLDGLTAIAAETGQIITAGGLEAGPDDQRAYNTAYTIAPNSEMPAGQMLAAYRKIHLFDALSVRESDVMAPGGERPPVIDVSGIRVGFATCYDIRFPELFRYLADQGSQLIIVPSAWYQGPMKEDHWLTLLKARAIENTLYVVGCNLIGPSFCGRSVIFDPFGVPLASAGEEETLILGKIRVERIEAVRSKLPCLQNRRRDIFEL